MLTGRTFLAVDLGAATLKLAEFERDSAGTLRLRRYGFHPLGFIDWEEATRSGALTSGLQALLQTLVCQAREVGVCAPASQVVSKFVKLPPVAKAKLPQIVQYEAQQNIPFPLTEVVWDYQLLGAAPGGELEMWLAAIKTDIAYALWHRVEAAGLVVERVDFPALALANAFRFNYGDLNGCSLLLNLGARSSTVLFLEGEKVFGRVLSVGAHAITQDFARDAGLEIEEAERIKATEGFVGLGETTTEPVEGPVAVLARTARQVLTRLHAQVNQTIQVYRSQHGGAAPTRLFLAGGGAGLPYLAQFFTEKLHLPVEYFNPLRQVPLDPALDLEALAGVAHLLGEVVGVGLRHVAHCPLELNLLPPTLARREQWRQREPWLLAGAACLILLLLTMGTFLSRLAEAQRRAADQLVASLQVEQAFKDGIEEHAELLAIAAPAVKQLQERSEAAAFWPELIHALLKEVSAVEGDRPAGSRSGPRLWLEQLERLPPKAGPSGLTNGLAGPFGPIEVQFGARDPTAGFGADASSLLVYDLLGRLRANPTIGSNAEPVGAMLPSPRGFHFRFRLKPEPPQRRAP
jgi:type IV pilus assembly protein PilM